MPKKPGANSRIVIDGYLSYSEIGEGEMSSTASAGRRTIEVLVRSTCVRIIQNKKRKINVKPNSESRTRRKRTTVYTEVVVARQQSVTMDTANQLTATGDVAKNAGNAKIKPRFFSKKSEEKRAKNASPADLRRPKARWRRADDPAVHDCLEGLVFGATLEKQRKKNDVGTVANLAGAANTKSRFFAKARRWRRADDPAVHNCPEGLVLVIHWKHNE